MATVVDQTLISTVVDQTLISTIDPQLALTEAQMIALPLDELEGYVSSLTAAATKEDSTIKGRDIEIGEYNTLIENHISSIDGLRDSINSYTLKRAGFQGEMTVLIANSTAIDEQIRASTIALNSTNTSIQQMESSMRGLCTLLATLESTYDENLSSYISTAKGYSTMNDAYIAANDIYISTYKDYETTSTQLVSTIVAACGSDAACERETRLQRGGGVGETANIGLNAKYTIAENAYQSSLAELNSLTREFSTLTLEKDDLDTSSIRITNEYRDADNSTIVLSSLYETSLIQQRYANALSTQGGIIEMHTSSITAEAELQTQHNSNPTNANKAALELAKRLVRTTGEDRSTITAEVNMLAARLSTSVDTALQTQINTIEKAILDAYADQSTFKREKEIAYENMRNASTLMESALLKMLSTINASTLYTSYYNSTINGLLLLQSTLASQSRALENDESEWRRLMKQVAELQATIDTNTDIMNVNIELSTLHTSNYRKAESDFTTYNDLYNSTMAGIAAMNTLLNSQDNEIKGLNTTIVVESSKGRKADIRIQIHGGEIIDGINNMNEGADRYKETFLREKRVGVQDSYEMLVAAALKAEALKAEPAIQSGGAISDDKILATPEILAKEAEFTAINTFLEKYDALYRIYNTQLENMSTFQSYTERLHSLQTDADSLYITILAKKETTPEIIRYNAKKGEIEDNDIKLLGTDKVIQTIQSTMNNIYPMIKSITNDLNTIKQDYDAKALELSTFQGIYTEKMEIINLANYDIYGDITTSDTINTEMPMLTGSGLEDAAETSSQTTTATLDVSAYPQGSDSQQQSIPSYTSVDSYSTILLNISSLISTKTSLEGIVNEYKNAFIKKSTLLISYKLLYDQYKTDLDENKISYQNLDNTLKSLRAQLPALESNVTAAENTIPETSQFNSKTGELTTLKNTIQQKAEEISTNQATLDALRKELNIEYNTFFTSSELYNNTEIVSSFIREKWVQPTP